MRFTLNDTFLLLCSKNEKSYFRTINAEISVCREAKMQTQSKVLFMKGPIWARGKQKVLELWAETGAEWVSGSDLTVSGCLRPRL